MEKIKPNRKVPVATIEICDRIRAAWGNAIKEALRQVPMRVNDSYPVPGLDVFFPVPPMVAREWLPVRTSHRDRAGGGNSGSTSI